MKYVWDAIRMVLISFECVFVLAVFVFAKGHEAFFVFLGDSMTNNSEVTKWLPVIPLGLSIYCFANLIWKLITPLNSSNKKLLHWPDFWRLKMRCYFSLFLSAVYAAVACVLWIFSKNLPHYWIGILFILSMGLSLINAGCMVFASFAVRIILESAEDSNSAK